MPNEDLAMAALQLFCCARYDRERAVYRDMAIKAGYSKGEAEEVAELAYELTDLQESP